MKKETIKGRDIIDSSKLISHIILNDNKGAKELAELQFNTSKEIDNMSCNYDVEIKIGGVNISLDGFINAINKSLEDFGREEAQKMIETNDGLNKIVSDKANLLIQSQEDYMIEIRNLFSEIEEKYNYIKGNICID